MLSPLDLKHKLKINPNPTHPTIIITDQFDIKASHAPMALAKMPPAMESGASHLRDCSSSSLDCVEITKLPYCRSPHFFDGLLFGVLAFCSASFLA